MAGLLPPDYISVTEPTAPTTKVQRGFPSFDRGKRKPASDAGNSSAEHLRSIVPYIPVPVECQRHALPNWPANTDTLEGNAKPPFNEHLVDYDLDNLLYDIEMPIHSLSSLEPSPLPQYHRYHAERLSPRNISDPWARHIVTRQREIEAQNVAELEEFRRNYEALLPKNRLKANEILRQQNRFDLLSWLGVEASSKSPTHGDESGWDRVNVMIIPCPESDSDDSDEVRHAASASELGGRHSEEGVHIDAQDPAYIPSPATVRAVLEDEEYPLTASERQWFISLLESRDIDADKSLTQSERKWYAAHVDHETSDLNRVSSHVRANVLTRGSTGSKPSTSSPASENSLPRHTTHVAHGTNGPHRFPSYVRVLAGGSTGSTTATNSPASDNSNPQMVFEQVIAQPLEYAADRQRYERIVWKEVSYTRPSERMDISDDDISPLSHPQDRKVERAGTPYPHGPVLPGPVAGAGPLFKRYVNQHMLKKSRLFSSRDSYSPDPQASQWPKVDAAGQARMNDSAEQFTTTANGNVGNDIHNDAFWDEFCVVDSDSSGARRYLPPRPVHDSPSPIYHLPSDLFSEPVAPSPSLIYHLPSDLLSDDEESSPPQANRMDIGDRYSANPDTRLGIRNKKEHPKAPGLYSFTFASSSHLPSPQPLPATVQAQLVTVEGEIGSWDYVEAPPTPWSHRISPRIRCVVQ